MRMVSKNRHAMPILIEYMDYNNYQAYMKHYYKVLKEERSINKRTSIRADINISLRGKHHSLMSTIYLRSPLGREFAIMSNFIPLEYLFDSDKDLRDTEIANAMSELIEYNLKQVENGELERRIIKYLSDPINKRYNR